MAELGCSYALPRTEFEVEAVRRLVVSTDATGSRRVPVVDVTVVSRVVPEPGPRQVLQFDLEFMEKIDISISLDDRGLIEAVNSEASRDLAPVLTVLGAVVKLAGTTVGGLAVEGESPPEPEPTLEDEWASGHQRLDSLRHALTERSSYLVAQIAAEQTTPEEVVAAGAAAEVVLAQLAALSEARRSWIADQARTVVSSSAVLRPADLLLVEGTELPEALPDVDVPPAQQDLKSAGVVVALLDPERGPEVVDVPTGPQVDRLVFRRPRPVTVAVYHRDEDGHPWSLVPEQTVRLDVVDAWSPLYGVSTSGSWRRSRSLQLAFHPDRSLKTFGFTSAPALSSAASGVATVLESAGGALTSWRDRPTAQQRELEKATTQLALAKADNDMEVLAATRTRAAELAAAEQRVALAKASATKA